MDQEFRPKNHSNTWTIIVVCAFVGVIFITATFIWQQIKMQENMAALTRLVASQMSVAQPSNVNTAEVISEDKNNSNLQTYTFVDAGYSIDIPKDWVAYSPYDGKAYPLSEEKYGGAFSVGPADAKSYVSIEVSKHSSTNFDILELYKKNTVADYETASGLTGYVVSNFKTPGATIKKVYLFKKDNVSYSFRVIEETPEAKAIVDNFTIINSNSDWQTYTSTDYSFSFKYPADWSQIESVFKGPDKTIGKLVTSNKSIGAEIMMLVNPDGFGPWFVDKQINLTRENGGLKVLSQTLGNSNNRDLTKYTVVAQEEFDSKLKNRLWIQFSFPIADKVVAEQIISDFISSIKFTN